jgi:hypothetical protein
MTRLSLKVIYLWRHVSSTAPPFILWWWNLEILFAPLSRSSPFIGELRCQAIQMEHALIWNTLLYGTRSYIAERSQSAIVRCLWVKHKLYPGFTTRFRGILSLIQVYIFEICVKCCVFLYPSWGGLKKKFSDPSYVLMRFFEAAPGGARAIEKLFLACFEFFTSKWNYCRVTGPLNKIFIKNQLTLVCSCTVCQTLAVRPCSTASEPLSCAFTTDVAFINRQLRIYLCACALCARMVGTRCNPWVYPLTQRH